jgi:hypothetical protein
MARLEALTRFFGLTARSPKGRTNFDNRTGLGREFYDGSFDHSQHAMRDGI